MTDSKISRPGCCHQEIQGLIAFFSVGHPVNIIDTISKVQFKGSICLGISSNLHWFIGRSSEGAHKHQTGKGDTLIAGTFSRKLGLTYQTVHYKADLYFQPAAELREEALSG